jgi:hypothetical protein
MATNKPASRRKRFLRTTLIITGVLALSILGLHIWFVHNAKGVLRDIVATKSGGKLTLELSNLSFDFFSNQLQIRQADLRSLDSTTQPTTYNVRFSKLTLRVRSFWPLLLQNKLLLDSIKLHDPQIEVMQWRRDTSARFARSNLSVPQEMGKLYNSMLDVLDGFGIRRIIINNAQVSLIDKTALDTQPVTISRIYFDLVRTADGTKNRDAFVENKQSIDLSTTDQNIVLPGGRHRISFKTFNLQLFRKRIVLDSCTITALATDNSKSSYTIFSKRLMLIGVDFNAMYRQNLIRADSVYCENPSFDIRLALDKNNKNEEKKERPDPEQIVRDLTGNLDLAFVGVKDAGIKIELGGSARRSLFNSNKDDFEMRGLRINSDSSQPVSVQRFDMLVQGYQLYNEDSSSAYSFDSIHFVNNKIALTNFSATTVSNQYRLRNYRDFKVPYFELTGLDWYELIFEQNLRAQAAVLYHPVITFTRNVPSPKRKKVNLFTSLGNLDSLMQMNKVVIVNGQVNSKFSPTTSLSLRDVNLSIYSDSLLQSTNQVGIRRAIDRLSFSNGQIRLKDITVGLENVRYTGKNLIRANQLTVNSKTNKIKGTMSDVLVENLLLDDEKEIIVMDGIRWSKAAIALKTGPAQKGGTGRRGDLDIKDITGANTSLSLQTDETSLTTFINSIAVRSLSKTDEGPVQLQGLSIRGNQFNMKGEAIRIKADNYEIQSNAPSFLSGVWIERIQNRDSLRIESPRIGFNPDINSILAADIHLSSLELQTPVITLNKWSTATTATKPQKAHIRIDHIRATEPVMNLTTHRGDTVTQIRIPQSANSSISVNDLAITNKATTIGSLSLNTSSATFVKGAGQAVGVEKGKVAIALSNMRFSKTEEKPSWSALINTLQLDNPNPLVFGKNRGRLTLAQATLGNVHLSSDYLTNFNELAKWNVSAWLRTATGTYADSNTTLNWYNAAYNASNKQFSLDSFRYTPTQPRDSVIKNTPYQIDYMTFKSGNVTFTNFDLEKYKKDSSIIAETMNITRPEITLYRDKQPPFLSGRIKPLPVDAIKRIGLPVLVNQLNIIDGNLTYTEKHAKTRMEGTLLLTQLNGGLSNIKNRNIREDDSLSLSLNGYLMDSTSISLRVKESYTDSLSGFTMTVRMRPTSLSFLNPVLAPLSNIKITSGTIDSFHLRAIGREYVSFGKMNMYYRDLKIKLIKDGDPENTTFFRNVLSALANTILIRNNNNGRTGLVYFERLRDRSFFNYIVKMTFSGMATSIGVVKNKRYLKRYQRELDKKELPAIPFD